MKVTATAKQEPARGWTVEVTGPDGPITTVSTHYLEHVEVLAVAAVADATGAAVRDITVTVIVPEAAHLTEQWAQQKAQAEEGRRLIEEAARSARSVAAAVKDLYGLRDGGHLLGIANQRVSQLAAAARKDQTREHQ